ncbi:MAG: IPT/TIG domain-containing protein [Terriglobales bacterium]
MTMRKRVAAVVVLLALALPIAAHAGGPLYVAGSGFNSGAAGTPLTWAGGQISYYTDQGDLSPLLRQSDANSFVADVFSRWTSVPTAALAAARAGQLDEDVSGANVTRSGTVLSMPADLQPASAKPFAIVYDYDGQVIDALLGTGASAAENCATNAVIGGPDRFTADAHIAHALLIMNGNCARASYDIPQLRYALTRAIGRALGLDWSQLNDNVFTRSSSPTTDDFSGFPMMHPEGGLCTRSYGCLYNADQLRMDDRAAISRLYPVTSDNLAQFAGKTAFASSTARIRGRVLFPDWDHAPGDGMQGVNIVARYVDPVTGAVSHAVTASSLSGFLFRGNAGNEITGFAGATGERFDHWGSGDTALRGAYDLAGLEIPAGYNSARFQLTVEAINPLYTGALGVGPYKLSQVGPAGTFAPLVLTVARGGDVVQDIVMQGAASAPLDSTEPHSFAQPAAIPGAGHWMASLGFYGDFDWHALHAGANRSFTLDITALDDSGAATTSKALPVIGLWAPDAAESDAPLAVQTWLNVAGGTTRLHATLASAGIYKLAIADARGDGRPDFRYSARLLYAGDVSPAQAAAGTVLRITGLGFAPGINVTIGGASAAVLSYAVDELLVAAPALPDGVSDLTLTDPATGATAGIPGAITYGGGGGTTLQLLLGSNPPVPVGVKAPNPFRVRVLAAGGVTPVAGASVTFTAPGSSVSLLPCNTTACVVATDGTGEADIWILVKASGATTITASLANGQTTSATVNGVSGSLMISAVPPKVYAAANTTASVPLLARVAGNNAALPGRLVEFQIMLGSGSLTPTTVTTDSAGEARSVLAVTNLASEVRVSACVGVAPQTACDIFYVYPVSAAGGVQLLKAGGDEQYLPPGQVFAPVRVRVSDNNVPPNPVSGMAVRFQSAVYRDQGSSSLQQAGEVVTGHRTQLVAISSADVTVYSDGWGQASYTPEIAAAWGAVRIDIQASIAGGQTVSFTLHTLGGTTPSGSSERPPLRKNPSTN